MSIIVDVKLLINEEVILCEWLLGRDDELAVVHLSDHMVIFIVMFTNHGLRCDKIVTARLFIALTTLVPFIMTMLIIAIFLTIALSPVMISLLVARTLVFELLATLANMFDESVLLLVVLSGVSWVVGLAKLASVEVLLSLLKLALKVLFLVTISVVAVVVSLAFPLTVLPVIHLMVVRGRLATTSLLGSVRVVVALVFEVTLVIPFLLVDRIPLLQRFSLLIVAAIMPVVMVVIAMIVVTVAFVWVLLTTKVTGSWLSKILLAIVLPTAVFIPRLFFALSFSARSTSLVWGKELLIAILLRHLMMTRLIVTLSWLCPLLDLVC